MKYRIEVTAALAMILAPIASAEIIHVPADHEWIQGAIDAAVDGDEIVVAPGDYIGPDGYAFIDGKSIVLRSTQPDDAGVVAATTIRGWLFVEGGDQNTVVDGFSFASHYGDLEASMVLYHSAATVRNCVWQNLAMDSSSIYDGILTIHGGSVVVERCRFSNNGMYRNPSMIACRNGAEPTLIENVISGNIGTGSVSFGVHSEEGCNPTLIGTLMCGNTGMTPVVGPWTDGGGNTLDGACPCSADIDHDGVVGFNDLLGVLAEWGCSWLCAADVDHDGEVGFFDLLAVLSSWGPCV